MPDDLRLAGMPETLQACLLGITAIAAIAVLGWAIFRVVRYRDPLALFVVIGTQLAAPYEGLGDRLLHVYYPEVDQVGFLQAFGRDIPLFVQLLYLPYIVPFVVMFVRRLQTRGFTTGSWWATWFVLLLSTNVMEMAVLQFGPAWRYYDDQPLVIFDIPVWVALTNTTFIFSIAMAAYLITRYTPRRRHWLIIGSTVVGLAAGHAVIAYPMHLALAGHADPMLVQFVSLAIGATIAGLYLTLLNRLPGVAAVADGGPGQVDNPVRVTDST